MDYREVDFADVVSDVDAVLDTIADDTRARSLRTLRRGGVLVSILPFGRETIASEAERLGARVELMLVEADQAGMRAVVELVESGRLYAEIAGVFPLAEAAKAHALGETNRATGKLVLSVE
ncbi:zinc-binding dehydrogenase [Saccharopolyspora sp. NPDC000995]